MPEEDYDNREKKTFVVGLDYRDGGNEYYQKRIIEAKSKEEAREKTHEWLSDYWGDRTEVDTLGDTKRYTSPQGYPTIQVRSITEVSSFEELKREMWKI